MAMKRNMDTIRKLILATAELPYGENMMGIDGMDENEFVMHAVWLLEAGLIEGQAQIGGGSQANFAIVNRLTWDGCEFADAISSDTLWGKAKEKVIAPGLSFTFDVLKEWLKSEITRGLPTIGG